jgi:hypothetical protein
MPLSEWKRLYSETIRNPIGHDLYARRAFFDFAPPPATPRFRQLTSIRLEPRPRNQIPLLANDTLAQCPR